MIDDSDFAGLRIEDRPGAFLLVSGGILRANRKYHSAIPTVSVEDARLPPYRSAFGAGLPLFLDVEDNHKIIGNIVG